MGDMLSNAVSGLQAFQTALDTISNNISNASTTGYSREVVNLAENAGQGTSVGFIGAGVNVVSVTRNYDEFLAGETRAATSSYNQLNTVSTMASSINNMIGDSTTGMSAELTSFTDALQSLSDSPSSTSARQAVIAQAQSLITQFKSYQSTLNQLSTQDNTSITSDVSTTNSLAKQIASLNTQIVNQKNETGQTPNQLMDERDNLVDQLSKTVSVNTVMQNDGSMNVYIGSGQPLVVGGTSSTLSTANDQYTSGGLDVTLQAGGGASVDITNSITGGTLGGELQFRTDVLTPAVNSLGQTAVALTTLVNQQNAQGYDENGDFGSDLMTVGGPSVLASSNNTGTASVTASVSDLSSLTTSNYTLRYDGTNWNLTDPTTGTSTTLTATANSDGTTTLTGGDGLTMTVSGTAASGDSFLVEPFANAVSSMAMVTTDPAKIAAAAPLVSAATSTNTGTGAVSSATVTNAATWTANAGDYTLTYGTSGWSVTDASGNSVTPTIATTSSGSTISFDGISVAISGSPATGDSFTVNDNAGGTGDNTNALALAAITSKKVLDGGEESVSDSVTSYIATIGLQTSQAQNGASAQQTVMQNAQTAQSSVSGVNLDEEAASMIQYEQAYQAAAQMISTAKSLFDSLISAVQAG